MGCRYEGCRIKHIGPGQWYCPHHKVIAAQEAYRKKLERNKRLWHEKRADPIRHAEERRKARERKLRSIALQNAALEPAQYESNITYAQLSGATGEKFVRMVHRITQEGYTYGGAKLTTSDVSMG